MTYKTRKDLCLVQILASIGRGERVSSNRMEERRRRDGKKSVLAKLKRRRF